MATDDKDTEVQTETQTTEENQTVTEETNKSESQVMSNDKMDEFLASLNSKIDEISKTYDKKIEELKTQLDEKTKENEKLKNVNAQILMNSSVSKGNNDVIDFKEVDFDDVNWQNEAKKYFGKIDTKIF